MTKPCPGFPNYEVTDSGEILSKGRPLVGQISHRGYHLVHLCQGGKAYHKSAHRLIAEAFVPNPLFKPQVNHKNGNKLDNRAENLEWSTNSENQIHKNRTLGKKYFGKITQDKAACIRSLYAAGASQRRLAEIFNVVVSNINKIVRGHTWRLP